MGSQTPRGRGPTPQWGISDGGSGRSWSGLGVWPIEGGHVPEGLQPLPPHFEDLLMKSAFPRSRHGGWSASFHLKACSGRWRSAGVSIDTGNPRTPSRASTMSQGPGRRARHPVALETLHLGARLIPTPGVRCGGPPYWAKVPVPGRDGRGGTILVGGASPGIGEVDPG